MPIATPTSTHERRGHPRRGAAALGIVAGLAALLLAVGALAGPSSEPAPTIEPTVAPPRVGTAPT